MVKFLFDWVVKSVIRTYQKRYVGYCDFDVLVYGEFSNVLQDFVVLICHSSIFMELDVYFLHVLSVKRKSQYINITESGIYKFNKNINLQCKSASILTRQLLYIQNMRRWVNREVITWKVQIYLDSFVFAILVCKSPFIGQFLIFKIIICKIYTSLFREQNIGAP